MLNLLTTSLVPIFCTLAAPSDVPKVPDLDVLFIEQWPVYPNYGFHYPGNLPVLVKPCSGTDGRPFTYYFTRDEYEASVKTRPDKGETVTMTAYVANKGGVSTSERVPVQDGRQGR